MPIRAIASILSAQATTIASSIGMGLFAGITYLIGTAGPETAATLNASTKIEGSPYSLGAIIASVAVATWFVSRLVTQILDKLDMMNDRIETLEDHAENCPGRRNRK